MLVRPYWFAQERQTSACWGTSFTVKEAWIARGLLAVIVALSILVVYISKLINSWNARFFNALQDKNADAFWAELDLLGGAGVVFFIVAPSIASWLRQLLTIRWRRWLSEVVLPRLAGRPHLLPHGADQPGHRQSRAAHRAGLQLFTTPDAEPHLDLLLQVMTLVTFAVVLWNLSGSFVLPIFGGVAIPGYMMWAALLYALVGSLADLSRSAGRWCASTSTLERYNADFRYRMTRIRENAESIALYRGEADEARGLRGAFGRIYDTWWDYMKYTKRLTWLTAFYGQAAQSFPIVVAAPQYFAGRSRSAC